MKTHSILNDVLGPVMAGPSSSHTAAPAKIGLAVRQLWGAPIQAADILYDEHGSYPGTHEGQGSDFGFAGGLLGMRTDEENFRDSLELAEERGVRLSYRILPLDARHPNEALLTVRGSAGERDLSVLSFSTGGGTFLIPEMDGFPVRFDGARAKAYLCFEAAGAGPAEERLKELGAAYALRRLDRSAPTWNGLPDGAVLFEAECASLRRQEDLAGFSDLQGFIYLRRAEASQVPVRLSAAVPFATAEEALRAADGDGLSMPGLALCYEMGLLDAGEQEIRAQMKRVMTVMRRSMIPPPAGDPVSNRLAPMIASRLKETRRFPVPMGALEACIAPAVAVMENSCAHRTVVAAPTAGSSGVIPAAVIALGDAMGRREEEILDALWAAGLVGAFIANEATFGAEVAGCQAEIGAAACMAAAGAVQLAGGSVRQGFDAACIAMQSLMGLICDPVGGLTEIPCIERNVTASAVAAMSANLAMAGMTSLIPLDETIRTMLTVGQQLPAELRCTCRGGLCVTESGKRLACSL